MKQIIILIFLGNMLHHSFVLIIHFNPKYINYICVNNHAGILMISDVFYSMMFHYHHMWNATTLVVERLFFSRQFDV